MERRTSSRIDSSPTWSPAPRRCDAGAFAVTVGAALTLFVLALCYVLVHPRSGAIDVLDVLEPAFASTLGIAVTTVGGASAIGVFESLGEA